MVKNPPANAGDSGSIPCLKTSPGGGNGNPLQYSCLENPMDRGALAGYISWGHKELDMTEHDIFKTDVCPHFLLTMPVKQYGILLKTSLQCQGDPGPGSASKGPCVLINTVNFSNHPFSHP